jgi:hypothetical protein
LRQLPTFGCAGFNQQSQALSAKLRVGGGYEIPSIPENKSRCGFGLERINKIRENAPQAIIIFYR